MTVLSTSLFVLACSSHTMKIALLAIAAGIAALLLGVALSGSPAIQAQETPEIDDDEIEQEQQVVMQIDIGNEFARFGDPGFFKLLADFTDLAVDDGHVAISNVQCDEDGTSPFTLVVANANVGPGNTELVNVELNASNLIDDLSFPGQACTYHVEVSGDDYEFPVTDLALANSNDTRAFTPLPTASATIRAEIAEQEGEGIEVALGDNSEVSLEGQGSLTIEVEEGDLEEGDHNITFSCADPEINEEFVNALTVEDGEGEFQQDLELENGTYSGCEVSVGDLTVELPEFTVPIGEDTAEDETRRFGAELSGANEVPEVDTEATGNAEFVFENETLDFTVEVQDIANVTAAHIHMGQEGENGDIVVTLFTDDTPDGAFDGELAAGTVEAEDLEGPLDGAELSEVIELLEDGNAYVNVHTEDNPDGEIRGQLLEEESE